MDCFQLFVAQAQPFHDAGSEALQHHVGITDQAQKYLTSLLSFEVQADTTFVAINCYERKAHTAGAERGHIATIVTSSRFFDLDYVRTKIRQHLRGIGTREQAR